MDVTKKDLDALLERRILLQEKPDLSESALIVIDMQTYQIEQDVLSDYLDTIQGGLSEHYLSYIRETVQDNVSELIRYYRRHSRPVFFTRLVGEDFKETQTPLPLEKEVGHVKERFHTSLFPPASDPRTNIASNLQPLESETIILKMGCSAFSQTELDSQLKELDIGHITLCGVFTNLCVESTARQGFDLGYSVTVVSDATAAFTYEIKTSSLKSMCYAFASIYKLKNILGQ